MKPRRSIKINEPLIPKLDEFEQLQVDNEELARAISRLKYHNLIVQEFLSDSQLETISRYAK